MEKSSWQVQQYSDLFWPAGLFHLLLLMSVPLWSIRWIKITENLVNQIWNTDFIRNIEFLPITKLWDETCQTATSNICCWKLEIPMIQTGRLYYYKVKPKTCHLCPFIVGIITGSFCLLQTKNDLVSNSDNRIINKCLLSYSI